MLRPQIKLKIEFIEELREYICENDYLLFNNDPFKKIWNILCACTDRIESTAKYLNSKILGKESNHSYSDALDLMEFLTISASLLDCIDTLIKILKLEDEIENPNIIFKNKQILNAELLNNKLNKIRNTKPYINEDDLYFEYIRSIGAIHPNDTNHHRYFQKYEQEVSPFLLWKDKYNSENGDILIRIYNSDGYEDIHDLHIWLSEIYLYIINRYERIQLIAKGLNQKVEALKNKLKLQKIKSSKSFNSYSEYLSNLYQEAGKRTDFFKEYIIYAKNMINLKNIPKELQSKYPKYRNALKYGIEDFRRLLQAPLLENDFDQKILLQELHLPYILKEDTTPDSIYYYEKAYWLYNTYDRNLCDINWVRTQAINLYESVKSYAPINRLENLTNKQLLAVLNTALYFYSLNHDTFINHKIPKSNEYR